MLFDTGDLIEGTGLSDATPIHGQYIFDIIKDVSTYNGLYSVAVLAFKLSIVELEPSKGLYISQNKGERMGR